MLPTRPLIRFGFRLISLSSFNTQLTADSYINHAQGDLASLLFTIRLTFGGLDLTRSEGVIVRTDPQLFHNDGYN